MANKASVQTGGLKNKLLPVLGWNFGIMILIALILGIVPMWRNAYPLYMLFAIPLFFIVNFIVGIIYLFRKENMWGAAFIISSLVMPVIGTGLCFAGAFGIAALGFRMF